MTTHSTISKMKRNKVETVIRNKFLIKQRREEIIRAAGKIFSEKGYHQTTIKDICEVCGIGPGTIYNYVRKKEDILYLIYDKLTTLLTKALEKTIRNNKTPLKQLKGIIKNTIEIVWENQDLILLMYQETAALDKKSLYDILHRESKYVALIEKVLKNGEKKGFILNKNIKLAADIIVYLFAFIPLRRWNLKKRFSEEEIKSGVMDFIFKALGIISN